MPQTKIRIEHVNYYYGQTQVLKDVTLDVAEKAITVFFGPSGGGKTTLLRLINRLNDLVDGTTLEGNIYLDGRDIYNPEVNVPELRRQVGMVFALPLPLPGTVRENVLYGPMLANAENGTQEDEILFRSLNQAALWDEVKDRLDDAASELSGGQQQRLCIARSLALEPDVLLLDEPTSGLDPISTAKVEESLFKLKQDYTIIVVPHSIQQAGRIADEAAFFLMGEMVEHQSGEKIFTNPQHKQTEDYITGRFG